MTLPHHCSWRLHPAWEPREDVLGGNCSSFCGGVQSRLANLEEHVQPLGANEAGAAAVFRRTWALFRLRWEWMWHRNGWLVTADHVRYAGDRTQVAWPASAAFTCAGVNGTLRSRTPVGSKTALPRAAATVAVAAYPAPSGRL